MGAGLVFQGVVAAVRPGAGQRLLGLGDRPLLEVDAAQKPGGLRVGTAGQDRLQVRPRLGGTAHPEEGPGKQLAEFDRLGVALGHVRVAVEHAAERLGGAGEIEVVAANDAKHHVSPRLPARLPAESLGRPCRCVQGMRPQVLWGLSLDRFLVEELGELTESLGRDRFGLECLVPGPHRAVIPSPTLQHHAQEQVVFGLRTRWPRGAECKSRAPRRRGQA